MSLSNVTVATPAQFSLVVTEATSTGGTWLAHITVIFCGQVMAGGTWSLTKMVCVHEAEFPQASVARYVRKTMNRFAQV